VVAGVHVDLMQFLPSAPKLNCGKVSWPPDPAFPSPWEVMKFTLKLFARSQFSAIFFHRKKFNRLVSHITSRWLPLQCIHLPDSVPLWHATAVQQNVVDSWWWSKCMNWRCNKHETDMRLLQNSGNQLRIYSAYSIVWSWQVLRLHPIPTPFISTLPPFPYLSPFQIILLET